MPTARTDGSPAATRTDTRAGRGGRRAPAGRAAASSPLRDSGLDQTVRVEHELLGNAAVEVLVTLRRVVERDDRGIDRLGDVRLVVEDHLHEAVVVLHH